MKRYLKLLIVSTVLMTFNSFAQILNNNFEIWTDINPDNWTTSNLESLGIPVSKSEDSHSGSFSVKGDVINSSTGETMLPVIISASDSTEAQSLERYNSLNLYYKFSPQQDDLLIVSVFLYDDIFLIGAGLAQISEPSDSYTELNVPIEYIDSGTPKRYMILIGAGNESDEIVGHTGTWFIIDEVNFSGITGVNDEPNQPEGFTLEQNYPNPFNPSTTISFNLPVSETVTLKIFNSIGQEIATLINNKIMNAGLHSVNWNAGNLSNGVYLYRLTAGKFIQTNKMTLLK